jgi:transcriptional regulator with XRE-family HTH domain
MANMESIKKAIGKRFREVRKALGLRQKELAKHLGCGRSNISIIENGQNLPGGSILINIKNQFNVSRGQFFQKAPREASGRRRQKSFKTDLEILLKIGYIISYVNVSSD